MKKITNASEKYREMGVVEQEHQKRIITPGDLKRDYGKKGK